MPRKKYEKPLSLDVPFEEALERFGQTAPAEVTAITPAMPEKERPVELFEDADTGHRFLVYRNSKGVQVELRYEGDTLWLSVGKMAEMYSVTRQAIEYHLKNIFKDEELAQEAVCKEILHTAADGKDYPTKLYNLDAIISVAYKVGGKVGTMIRIWATDKLVRFAKNGFVVDVERLKDPAEHDHFADLRRVVQDIRASETNVYAELRRILAMCSDYDPKASGPFFATFQNKLHFAVVGQTAAQIIVERADASQPNMGLVTWPKDDIRKQDTETAKNYLHETDMRGLNRATNMLLDYFEDQVERQRLVTTTEAEDWLDKWLRNNDRPVLPNKGLVSAPAAKQHAHREYALFDGRRRAERKKQADAALAALRAEMKRLPQTKKLEKKG